MSNCRFLFLPLCLLSASSYAGSQMRLFAGVDSSFIETEEIGRQKPQIGIPSGADCTSKNHQLNKESGSLLGGGIGFEWLSESGVYYGGTLDRTEGDVEYSGETQLCKPIKGGTSYIYYWRPKVYAGKEIQDWWFKPRLDVEVGGQLKERHIDPRTDGIEGYEENYTWWYSGVGISFEFLGNDDWSWRSGWRYRMMIQPKNDTTISKRDIDLGATASFSLVNSIYLNLGEDLFLGIELDITKTRLNKSREFYDGIVATEESSAPSWISQPESHWQDVNLRVAMSKRFDF